MFKGISKRWLINTFSLILGVILLLVIILSVTVHSLCYGSIETALNKRCEDLAAIFPDNTAENTDAFLLAAAGYADGFAHKDEMEIEVINAAGRVVLSSVGIFSEDETVPDYASALKSDNATASYVGRSASGERIMAVSRVIRNAEGSELGAVRYISSLRGADSKVLAYTLIGVAAGLILIIVVAFTGYYFIRSIVKPVSQMTDSARRIALRQNRPDV